MSLGAMFDPSTSTAPPELVDTASGFSNYSTSDPMFYLTAPVLSWNMAMDNLFSTTGVRMPNNMTNPNLPPPNQSPVKSSWPTILVIAGVTFLIAKKVFK